MRLSEQVSALLGRIPSAVGYQPTLATDMGTMQERITTTKKGSITSVQASINAVFRHMFCLNSSASGYFITLSELCYEKSMMILSLLQQAIQRHSQYNRP